LRSEIDRLLVYGKKKKYSLLLMFLLILIVATPFFPPGMPGHVLVDILLAVIFFSALYGVSDDRRQFATALFLIVTAYLLESIYLSSGKETYLVLANLFFSLFLFFLGTIFSISLLKSRQINVDTLDRAIVIYLLAGLLWAILYFVLSVLDNGAFQVSQNIAGKSTFSSMDFLYFSYFTLAGITFGDIVPLSKPAFSLVLFEVFIGTFYIAIIIAKLIGGLRWGSE